MHHNAGYTLHPPDRQYGGRADPGPSSRADLTGHMAHSGYENPMDLSSNKPGNPGRLVKEEGHHHGYLAAMGTTPVSVGIPDHVHSEFWKQGGNLMNSIKQSCAVVINMQIGVI